MQAKPRAGEGLASPGRRKVNIIWKSQGEFVQELYEFALDLFVIADTAAGREKPLPCVSLLFGRRFQKCNNFFICFA